MLGMSECYDDACVRLLVSSATYSLENVGAEQTIAATDLRDVQLMDGCQMAFEMLHLVEFVVAFRAFVVSLTLMVEHVTLKKGK